MAAPKVPKGKKWIKLSWGHKIVIAFVTLLGRSFIFRPIITAFSAISMYVFNSVLRRYPEEAAKMAARISNIYFSASNKWVAFASSYMKQLTGKEFPADKMKEMIGGDVNKTAKQMAQSLGHEFLGPMFNMIMPGTGEWDKYRQERGFPKSKPYTHDRVLNPSDGLLGAERFLGINLQFQLQAWMLHFIGDTVSMGSMKSLKDLPNAISWSYGVGWLSWLVMGTPFRFTIADPLERLLNTIFRTKELSPAQVIDAYNSGYVTPEYFWRTMREAGYEEDLIYILHSQGSTKIPTGTLKDLYLHNRVSDKIAREELKLSGYTDTRIARMMQDWKLDRYDKLMEKLAGEAIDSYEKGQISEADLAKVLETVGWEDIEEGNPIDLQIQISNLKRAQSGIFTKAELRQLYSKNLITDQRVKESLEAMGYSKSDAELLYLYWFGLYHPKEPVIKPPEPKRLSKSEIRALFDAGLLTVDRAREKLSELNYSINDINNLITLWEGKKAEVIEALEAKIEELEEPEARVLSKSEIQAAWAAGLITLQDYYDNLIKLNYTESDAMRLTRASTGASEEMVKGLIPYTEPAKPPEAKKLSKSEVKALYESGIMTLEEAGLRLGQIGYTDEDASSIISLWTPRIEGPPTEEIPEYVPPPRVIDKYTLKSNIDKGLITSEEAFNALVRLGYSDFIAQLFTALWTGRPRSDLVILKPNAESVNIRARLPYYPTLSIWDIQELYKGGIINKKEASEALLVQGYTSTDADLLIRGW